MWRFLHNMQAICALSTNILCLYADLTSHWSLNKALINPVAFFTHKGNLHCQSNLLVIDGMAFYSGFAKYNRSKPFFMQLTIIRLQTAVSSLRDTNSCE